MVFLFSRQLLLLYICMYPPDLSPRLYLLGSFNSVFSVSPVYRPPHGILLNAHASPFFVAVLNDCTTLLCYTGNSVAPWSPFERLKLWAPSCYICSICRLLLFSHSLSKLLTKKMFETLCLFLCICSITFLHSVPC